MHINKQINNLFYTIKRQKQNQSINILYDRLESFFDAAIFSDSSHSLIPILNTENNTNFINQSFYSAVWINDIINFSQKIPTYANYYTNYILAIHSPPSSLFKREDLIILKKNIDQYSFISFCNNTELWPMKNIERVSYGVPKPTVVHNESRPKDILIINLRKQKQIDILYQYIKQKFPLTDMMHQASLNINDIHSIVSQYKICIDIDNYYNLLVANSCGCFGITALQSNDESIITINSSNEIIDIIPRLMSIIKYKDISNEIIKKYDWQSFCTNVCSYRNKILSQGFTI